MNAPSHGALLTIDLRAMAANWRALAARAAPAECAAVVKADAYGVGIAEAVPALVGAGCRTFFVAHLSEGVLARAAAPQATVYVLNGLPPAAAPAYHAQALRPVLGAPDEIDEWAREGAGVPCAIHVDTAMNRLGLPVDEFRALASTLAKRVNVALLMSHLSSAEETANPATPRQCAEFAALRTLLPHVAASLANSSGVFRPERPFHDLVRPGYALYGGNPTPEAPNPMAPVVTLTAPIVQLRTVEAGDAVGYNSGWTARRRSRIATISVGYADGWLRAASAANGKPAERSGVALVGGVRCPYAGRVSMDLVTLDVTDAPASTLHRGAPATLIGDGLDVDEVGLRGGSIGYEVLTGLGGRYRREYLRNGETPAREPTDR